MVKGDEGNEVRGTEYLCLVVDILFTALDCFCVVNILFAALDCLCALGALLP